MKYNLDQETADMTDPKQKFAWAFVHLPETGGKFLTHPKFYYEWSEHMDNLGFVHGPWLAAQANEDGYIHVSQIPKQKYRLRKAPGSQVRSTLNGATMWVRIGRKEETPETVNHSTESSQEVQDLDMGERGSVRPVGRARTRREYVQYLRERRGG